MKNYISPGDLPVKTVILDTENSYDMTSSDSIVEVNLFVPSTVSIVTANTNTGVIVGKIYTIVDAGRIAGTYPITITPFTQGQLIGGASQYVINSNGGSVSFYYDGTNLIISGNNTTGLENTINFSILNKILAHDGVSQFYTTPIAIPNFKSAAYSGYAFAFQGYDWFQYVINPNTFLPITNWPIAATGPCYGRPQAANIGAGGNTVLFFATHGNTSGATGSINALNSDGTSLWTKYNVYVDEGFNDGFASCAGEDQGVLGVAITTTGATSITLSTFASFPTTFPFYFSINSEIMQCTVGGGSSGSWTVVRGLFGTTAATHIINSVVNGTLVSVGGTTTIGGTTSSGGNFSLTVGGTNPNWPNNAWTRYQGFGFGAFIKIVSGTGIGQIREISGVGSGNQIFTVNAWSVNPDNTSVWQIMPRFQSDLYFQHAGTLNVESGTTYLYTTCDDCTIVKRNALTGAKVWRYWAGENNEPFPLIAPVTDSVTPAILFNSIDGYTYCLTTSGSLNWRTLGTSGVGLDSFLSAANVSNSGSYLNVIVNQRRSGNSAAGRTYILRGDTGAKVSESGDQLGDMASQPLLIPRTDGSNKYNIFASGNACLLTLYNDQMNGLWQNRFADNSGIDQFRSSPQLADVNYDGENEILIYTQNSAVMMILSQAGEQLGQLMLPCRLNATDCGVEGIPWIGDFVGDGILRIIIPSKDAYIYLAKFTVSPP